MEFRLDAMPCRVGISGLGLRAWTPQLGFRQFPVSPLRAWVAGIETQPSISAMMRTVPRHPLNGLMLCYRVVLWV